MEAPQAAQIPASTETSPKPPETARAPPAAPQTPPEATTPSGETGEGERDENGRHLSREAAGYRRRLRETETQRDQLREQLDRRDRAEVERIAGAQHIPLSVPSDVWQFGATLDAMPGEDGSIDPKVVEGLVAAIIKDRPGLSAVPIGLTRQPHEVFRAVGPPRESVGLSQLLKP